MLQAPDRLSLTAFAAVLLLSGGTPLSAAAQDTTPNARVQKAYSVPAGSLTAALNRFAQQAGLALSFDPTLAQGKASPGLDGSHDIDGGFAALLAGTGLQAVRTGEGAYSLKPQDGAMQLAPVRIEGRATGDAQVTTEGGGYAARAVSVGAKTAQSLREIPRSVSVISRQQLDDQRITTLDEVMDQMPGVTSVPGGTGYAATSYYSRGFQITSVLVDGSPASSWSDNDTSGNIGMSKYDSVQLLRGPNGVFSGNGQPSGSVNLIRKQPLDHFQLRYAVSAGSWDNYFGEIDVTNKLVESGRIRGRFVAAYNDREFFFNGADRQVSTLFGTIAADLTALTTLTLGISQDRDEGAGRDVPPGFPRYSDGSPIPIPREQGYTSWSYKDTEVTSAFAIIDHAFSDAWKGRINVFRSESESATGVSSYNGAADPLSGLGSYLFQGTWAESDFETTAIDAHLSGEFLWLERLHKLVVGTDFRQSEDDTRLIYARAAAGRADITDWSNTDPDVLLPESALIQYPGPAWLLNRLTDQSGLYAYGDFQIVGPLNLVLGGRYSRYKLRNGSGDRSGTTLPGVLITNNSNGEFTPYYALKYVLSTHWTSYFAVAESFEDQSDKFTEGGDPLDPVRGRSYELGIKGEHWDGRLNSNITFYRSTRDNFAVRVSQPDDFEQPGRTCCYVGDGEFLARGVELEVSGQLLRNWQLNGGFTYDDNETEFGASDGLRYASYTPKNIFRVWTRYDLPGMFSGWTAGGGVRAQSSFFRSGTVRTWNPEGGPDGTGAFDGPTVSFDFVEPGRAVWNAFVEYRPRPKLSLALNVNNLFDKHYFRSVDASTSTGNRYGDPRSVSLTLRGTFD